MPTTDPRVDVYIDKAADFARPILKEIRARVPTDLTNALKKNKKARIAFAAFSPSHKREYVEWITEARREATRQKRVTTAVKWIAERKARNWKYE